MSDKGLVWPKYFFKKMGSSEKLSLPAGILRRRFGNSMVINYLVDHTTVCDSLSRHLSGSLVYYEYLPW